MTKFLPPLRVFSRFFTLALLLLGSTALLNGNAKEPCVATAAEGAEHAVWLNKYQNGNGANFYFTDGGGKLEETEDGRAIITGTIYNIDNNQDKWKVTVWLSDRMTWDQWSALGRGYKDEKNVAGDLYKTWSYYIMDPNQESVLKGIGMNQGQIISLSHNPTDYHYGFQVGQAANSKNEKYGLSGWILHSKDGENPFQGDFNLDLDCHQPDDPHQGANCLATAFEGGHAMWMGKYLNGENIRFIFDDNGGSLEQYDDGTAHISGTVFYPDMPDDKWELNIWLSDQMNWDQWSALGRSYKDPQNVAGDLYETWTYYILDPNKPSELIGKGKNEGETITILHFPADYEFGAQVGQAANAQNENYGLSVWFSYWRDGKEYRGDFNFELDCPQEPECDVNNLAANFVSTDISCFGAQDGAVDVTVTGGLSPFTFAWSNGATTQDLSNLSAGNYSVTITDANGATLELAGTVFEPEIISLSGVISPLTCGGSDGAINITVGGGTAPFSYSWSNGSSTRDLSNLGAGTYDLTLTDANGCTASESFTLVATSDITAVISASSCNDGSLTLDVTGGVGPFSYAWSTGETTKDITVDALGTYDVTVTDVNGCSTTASVTLDVFEEFSLSVTTVIPSCGGNSDGSMDLTVTGGEAPYTYSWSNGDTTEDLTDVPSANYTVTVTDARGCTQTLTEFLRNPVSIFISADITGLRCDGNPDEGAVDISIFNVAEPYTVSWSNGATTEDLSGLVAGLYTITVTDANGCSAARTIEILEPADFEVDISSQYCGDGRICPQITGGTGPFTYVWNGPSGPITTVDGCIDVTEGGEYTAVVTDDNGCTKTSTITIGAPNPQLSTQLVVGELTCAGDANATADLTISGGEQPYTITWSTGATTEDVSGLGAGTYTVRIEDVNGCSEFRAFSIAEPQALEITAATLTEVSCDGESDGTIDITVQNGTAPYTYSWSNGATTEDLTAVAAGTYTVSITDANGCGTNMSYDIIVNPDNTNCDPGDGGDGNGDGNGDGGNGDGNGDGTGNDDPCVRDCNVCDGKISTLTLKYMGMEENAQVVVKQRNGGQVVYEGTVSADDEFTFVGADKKGTLSSEIIIFVNGAEATNIHTSCSQPIGPGLISGDFEVIAGESRNGGPLCPVEPGTTQDEDDKPKDENCEECFYSEILNVEVNDEGCVKYQVKVSNNGNCAHALSHFTVRVPCGIVTDASNSEGWAMELNSKDPTTNLYGFKVDDIHGFAEDGQAGSFTVEYTVCSNDNEDCLKDLMSESVKVAYKAGQCVAMETLEIDKSLVNGDDDDEEQPITFVRFNVFPNPVHNDNSINIEFTHANLGEEVIVQIQGLRGRTFSTATVVITEENQIVPLSMAGIDPGVYFLSVTSRHKVYTEKLIIK